MASTTTVLSMKDKNDSLVIVPGELAIMTAPYGTTVPTTMTDTTGALQALPAGWQSAGEIEQKSGASITPNVKTNDIMGYGSMVPRRTVKTSEGVDIDFTAQEIRRVNLSLFWGMDLSSVKPNATNGEWNFTKNAQATMQYFSMILLGLDNNAAGDIYPYWIFPKVSVTKQGKITLTQDGALSAPITLTAYQDNTVGGYVIIGQGGVGNQSLNNAAGFPMTITNTVTITGTPTAGTFTLSFGGQTTSGIAYNATASAVQSALGALTSIGSSNVTVTGSAGGPYTVTITGVSGTLTASGAGLTGGTSPSVTVS